MCSAARSAFFPERGIDALRTAEPLNKTKRGLGTSSPSGSGRQPGYGIQRRKLFTACDNWRRCLQTSAGWRGHPDPRFLGRCAQPRAAHSFPSAGLTRCARLSLSTKQRGVWGHRPQAGPGGSPAMVSNVGNCPRPAITGSAATQELGGGGQVFTPTPPKAGFSAVPSRKRCGVPALRPSAREGGGPGRGVRW